MKWKWAPAANKFNWKILTAIRLSSSNQLSGTRSADVRVGGGYRMSLFYPTSEQLRRGKTSVQEYRFIARFGVSERLLRGFSGGSRGSSALGPRQRSFDSPPR